MNTRAQTLRNTAFSSVGMYTEYVLGMLTSIVIARHLGPAELGAYGLVIWLVALGVAVTNSGTASAAIKFVAELRGADRLQTIPALLDRLRAVQRIFLLAVLVVGAMVFLFAGDHLAPGMNHWLLLGVLVVGVALRSSYMFNIGVAKGFENFRATAVIALIATPTNLALVLLAWWLDASVEWFFAVFCVSGVVFYAVSAWQVAPLLPPGDAAPLPATLLARTRRHMAWTTLTVSVGFMAASEVEVLFLNLYSGAEEAGHFKVAYQLALGAAMLVPGVFGALMLPMMSSALSQGKEVAAQRFVASTTYLALLALPLMAFGALFAEPIIGVLYGHAYSSSAPAFAVCLAVASLTVMTQAASSMLISADRQRSILVLVGTCAALKVGLDALLISHYGLAGAVAAYAAVGLFAAGSMTLLAIRTSGARLQWRRMGRVLLAAVLSGLVILPLRGELLPAAQVVVGGGLLMALYLPLTLLLRCWSQGDIEHLQLLHQRFAAGRPTLGARFLQWAMIHAGERRSA